MTTEELEELATQLREERECHTTKEEVAETYSASAEPDRKYAEREEPDGKQEGVAPPTPHFCDCETEYRLETDDL